MTGADKMQPAKRCGHRKWPLPDEKQLVDTVPKNVKNFGKNLKIQSKLITVAHQIDEKS